ncbi:unnamed protein product [Caenorhabditis bovis]|uniref:Cytochrome c oxidase assembly factor 3 n=1 Tax=Caenorhabditis bovis TaxID=2654633 RepID=A0A8S1ETQ4_9PELO|nr:unnamed protein product [Caenorhabditis bovis]
MIGVVSRRIPLKAIQRSVTMSSRMADKSPAVVNSSQISKKKDDDMLETIDIEDLPRAQKRFAKQFEKVNEERVKELFARNYKNHAAFATLLAVVVGIYWYTMYSVKQETFLEEIDQEMAATKPETHGHLAKTA